MYVLLNNSVMEIIENNNTIINESDQNDFRTDMDK